MKSRKLIYSDSVWALILLLPSFLGFLIFLLIPIVASLFLSFTEWDLVSQMRWVGVANYVELAKDKVFLKSLWNTVYFTVANVPVVIVLPLLLAVALNQKIRFTRVYRSVFFLPVIGSMIAVGLVWRWFYNPQFGLFNYILGMLGVKGPSWLSSMTWSMPAVIIVAIWKGSGFNMLVFLAGLQGIPDSYYEAADVDGANWFSKLLHITVPLLSTATLFNVIISVINSFQVFDLIYVMTGGGPGRATSVLVYYLYQNAFGYFRMGYASAMAYVLFFMVLFFTIIQLSLQRTRIG